MINQQNNRYNSSGMVESEYEPGSRRRVLKNLCRIKSSRKMEKIEYDKYIKVIENFIDKYGLDHKFTVADICAMHKMWLGDIYAWAGKYRQINMAKGNFHFSAAHLIPKLMKQFEQNELNKYTPCNFKNIKEVIKAISIVHVELILIHPFREGNGRIARVISLIMAIQAGFSTLDFSGIIGRKRQAYFAAVRAGLDNYEPMEKIIRSVINRTIKICQK